MQKVIIMGLFSNLTRSWKKSTRLQELEKLIAPPNQSVHDLVSAATKSSSVAASPRDRALDEFLDLCESDEGIKQVMAVERLSRQDLKELYTHLLAAGLGQWIKGHYVALSTIAYVEPLQYTVRSQRMGNSWPRIVSDLLAHWEERISSGALLDKVR